jgi:uncharacterized protein Yka (UPF0111/DUF47 family)
MKSEIVAELGQSYLLLPSLIAKGLAANDSVKLRLSLLQAAARRASTGENIKFELGEECRAAGIDPAAMQILVEQAAPCGEGRMTAPGLSALGAAVWRDLETMAEPIEAADKAQGDAALARLAAIEQSAPFGSQDDIAFAQVSKLTAVTAEGADSLHRLIMDLHKLLNGLAKTHAEEVIAGAHASGLTPQDRPAVEAFMRGLKATERLRFGHPGLATTAVRTAERFTIQNDIGETDAHVVVIAVDADSVTVTYSDVHLPRAKFFVGLFRGFDVQWSGLERKSVAGLAEGGVFYLITGRYSAAALESRHAFLEAVGSSLVFLIDWNKARKVLRGWVPKNDAIQILDWAARHRFGHRGFLELGGAELLSAAVRHAVPTRIGFGEQLDRALGREAAVDFLKTVLRISAEALLAGGSERLARDRIEADLVRRLQRVEVALLAIVVRQAGLARELGAAVANFVEARRNRRPFDCAALVKNARHIEEKADRIAMEARGEIARLDAASRIASLVNLVEAAIDELEQAAFIASLVPAELGGGLIAPLDELCGAVLNGTEAAAAGTAAAAEVPDGHRVDSEDALAATGRLIDAEHAADAAERKVTAQILTGEFDQKTALSVIELARALERATDRLAGFGHVLREHVLADLAS